ncbi:PTS transporter subunit EIIC [Haliangium ochraceum]|uniref:PTS system, glucose-like IIB subunint n=1 Tax=Haliangium ochraceum (strain DSM 14365 / JCM 11303 / SMP-2) TaxID=502025 RepID=D0LVP8_HALO1|nr:PTS transporter subunit EIIC [Haliangium ochraceum]ACY14032.1 PTS system, glucose-like IIB subunint [Haliangium ochraceum DSM 14365]
MLEFLQRIGRSLMLPIAVMPAAALLMRLGAPDVLDLPFIQAAGSEIFVYLPLLFAAGIVIGMTADKRGEAVLAAVVGYFVLIKAMGVLLVDVGEYAADAAIVSRLPGNPLIGIIAGLVTAALYSRFSNLRLPEALGFFSGRRLVPILTSVAMLVVALALVLVWPLVWDGLASFNEFLAGLGALGAAVFGFLNRLLLLLGLHHVMNSFFWFNIGEFVTPEGTMVVGDIPRFLAGDPSAGVYQVGFYPVMMGGLVGAALAMIRAARPENRRKVAGILGSAALVSFATGITEPLEFSFVFVAPLLYGVHALLTGVSMYLTVSLGMTHGFGFSAGLIDYVLNFGLAQHPLGLAVVTVAFFVLYFAVFSVLIRVLNLRTLGRGDAMEDSEAQAASSAQPLPVAVAGRVGDEFSERAAGMLAALGGRENVDSVDSCATRLRLGVRDSSLADEGALMRYGAKGVIRPSERAVQIIIGSDVQFFADALAHLLAQPADADQRVGDAQSSAKAASEPERAAATTGTAGTAAAIELDALLDALGGADNLDEIAASAHTRLRVEVKRGAAVDESALRACGVRGVLLRGECVELLVGAGAEQHRASLQALRESARA